MKTLKIDWTIFWTCVLVVSIAVIFMKGFSTIPNLLTEPYKSQSKVIVVPNISDPIIISRDVYLLEFEGRRFLYTSQGGIIEITSAKDSK